MKFISRNSLLALSILFSSRANAVVLELDAGNAAAPYRQDDGIGLCGTFSQLTDILAGKVTPRTDYPNEIYPYLDADVNATAPAPTPYRFFTSRLSTITRQLDYYATPQASSFGFFSPGVPLPFSAPVPGNPNETEVAAYNIITRIRGYLNVKPGEEGLYSFFLKADDIARFSIGFENNGTRKLLPKIETSQRQTVIGDVGFVRFKTPGMYPVELLYAQMGSAGLLELAKAKCKNNEEAGCPLNFEGNVLSTNLPSGVDGSVFVPQNYTIIKPTELMAYIYGHPSVTEPSCDECKTNDECRGRSDPSGGGAGSYCLDKTCQQCKVSAACGALCLACPSDKPVCSSDGADFKCVQCDTDNQCAAGQKCNTQTHTCYEPTCNLDTDCAPGKKCQGNVCVEPPVGCRIDTDCKAGQKCQAGICVNNPPVGPVACGADGLCPNDMNCDAGTNTCMVSRNLIYVGGCQSYAENNLIWLFVAAIVFKAIQLSRRLMAR